MNIKEPVIKTQSQTEPAPALIEDNSNQSLVERLEAELSAANAGIAEANSRIAVLRMESNRQSAAIATLTHAKEEVDEDQRLIQIRITAAGGGLTPAQATAVHNRQKLMHLQDPTRIPHPRDIKFRNYRE